MGGLPAHGADPRGIHPLSRSSIGHGGIQLDFTGVSDRFFDTFGQFEDLDIFAIADIDNVRGIILAQDM
jgi:hypothetical protein